MTDKELEQIYNEAYKVVYWTAMVLLKNEADAEDIVQDTFVSLIESYDSIEDKSKVVSWLKKNAANKCLNRLTRTKTDNVEDEFFESVEAVPEDFLPDSIVESEDTRKIIMDIIGNVLSEDVRRTLILFYFDEMSTKEIAAALGIPQGTVLWRLNFAKKKIKKEVEKYEEENDTKLYGMAIPFLTKLFAKEAEKVAFKPLPASLSNLSASAKAPENGAGIKASTEAAKKGTDIMKTKILIGSIAAVVAVGATVGIIIGVIAKKNDKKPSNTRDTVIEEPDNNGGNYDDDVVTYFDDDDETETPKATQKITEDSIFMAMDDMSADEMAKNIWKLRNVYVGMSKEEFEERLIVREGSKVKSNDNTFYWLYYNWADETAWIGNFTIGAAVDEDTQKITRLDSDLDIQVYLYFKDEATAKEAFDALIKEYESRGYPVTDDSGYLSNGGRVVDIKGVGRVSCTTGGSTCVMHIIIPLDA